MTSSRVTAIVVHYGDQHPTAQLANSLAELADEVLIVANDLSGRPDELDGRVEWLVPPRNLGYGDAFNFAILDRSSSAYVLLNTDIVMPQETFVRCLETVVEPGVGIVAPVLRYEDGSLQSGAARLTRWRRAPRVLVDPGAYRVDCTWVTGAAMFIREEVAREVGMDGSYFLGAEDADLCVRAGRMGWRVICRGDVSATHFGSQVITGPRWNYYATRNHVWWTRANFGLGTAGLNWLGAFANLPRLIVADLFKRRSLTSTRLALLGLRHAWWVKPDREHGSLAAEPLAARVMTW